MSQAPSDRQVQILRVVEQWIAAHGEAPSVREIGETVGLSSTGSVAYQLGQLEERGLIRRNGRRWRSIRPTR